MAGGRKRSVPDKALRQLQKAHELMEERDWIPARELLNKLNREHPNREDILAPLALTHYHLNELPAYLGFCIQVNKLLPNDPEHRLALASAYLMNERPALARLTLDQFLKRWPNHEVAGRAREMFAGINKGFDALLEEIGIIGDDAYELAALHEESRVAMENDNYKEGIAKAQELLRRKPDVKSAYNNLSLMQFYSGEIAGAIASAEQALRIKPDDYHALSNLTRYLLVDGREAEARRNVERLKASPHANFDRWIKQAEACATIGDDQGVLEALDGAETTARIAKEPNGFFIYHLAGVAAWRLGREDEARDSWKKCLKIAPGYDTARENLADSRKPAAERNGPWSFTQQHWISKKTIDDLQAEAKHASKRGETLMTSAIGRFLQKHPEMLRILPILLERGEPEGRQFAIQLATWARTPETTRMLTDFALSQNGPDDLRMKAAHEAQGLGAPLSSVLRLWVKGEWQDLILHTTEITTEPKGELPPEVTHLMAEASDAMEDRDGVKGEMFLKQALELAPDAPSLLNNLAMAYTLQGRHQEADALIKQLIEKHPDYLFARIHLAHRLIKEGKYDAAEELLKPMMSLDRMRVSEATALYNACINLYLQRGDREAAQRWFNLLEKIDPEDRNIEHWRSELKKLRGRN
jgi:Flp pilus assembly protein TadD